MKILIVEDDTSNMRVLSKLVRKLSGPEDDILQFLSFDLLKRYFDAAPLPDLVFCDYEMPEYQGDTVARHLKHLGFKGKFHFVTACDLSDEIKLLADSVIQKPMDKQLIAEAILDAKRASSEE